MIMLTPNFLALLALFSAAGSQVVTPASGLTVAVNREDMILPLAVSASPIKVSSSSNADRHARVQHRGFASRLLDLPLPEQLRVGRLGHALFQGVLNGDKADDQKRSVNSRIIGRTAAPVAEKVASSVVHAQHPIFSSRILGRSYTIEKEDEFDSHGKDTTGAGKSMDDFTYGDGAYPDDTAGGDDSGNDNDNSDYIKGILQRRDVPSSDNTTSPPVLMVTSANTTTNNGTFLIHPFVGTVLRPDNTTVQHVARASTDSRRVSGIVDIVSNVNNSPQGIRLASLVLTNGTTDGYQLDADSHKHTTMSLVMADPDANLAEAVSEAQSPSEVPVHVEMEVFSQTHDAVEPWCATYNASPSGMTRINVEPCREEGLQAEHKSQTFLWNKATSVIRPMFWAGEGEQGPTFKPLSGSSNNTAVNSTLPSMNIASVNETTSSVPIATASLLSAAAVGEATKAVSSATGLPTAPPAFASAVPPMLPSEKVINAAKAFVDHKGPQEHVQAFQSTYDATASHPPLGARDTANETPSQNVTLIFHPDAPMAASVTGSYDPTDGKLMASASLASSSIPSATMLKAAEVTVSATSVLSSPVVSASVIPSAIVKIADFTSTSASASSSSLAPSASASGSAVHVAEVSMSASTSTSGSSSASASIVSSSAAAFKAAEVSITSSWMTASASAVSSSAAAFKAAEASATSSSMSTSAIAASSSMAPFKAADISATTSTTVTTSAVASSAAALKAAEVSTSNTSTAVPSSSPAFGVAEVSSSATASTVSASQISSSANLVHTAFQIAGVTLSPVFSATAVPKLVSPSMASAVSSMLSAAEAPASSSSGVTSSASSSAPSATATKMATRNAPRMMPVDTEPYQWQFSREQ